MQHITYTIQNFRRFFEANEKRNLRDAFEKRQKGKQNQSFEEFVLKELGDIKSEFESSLTEVMLRMTKVEHENLLYNVNLEIDHVISLCEKITEYDSSFLTKYFTDFKNYFNKKYHVAMSVASDRKGIKPINKKIKWLGNLNTLTTCLIQLLDGNNTLKKTLIECDIQQLKDLVLNNFTGKDGSDFSVSTIDTYFDTNKRDEKQAKKEKLILSDDGDGFAEVSVSAYKFKKANQVRPQTSIPQKNDMVD